MAKKFDYSLRGKQYTDEELRDVYETELNLQEETVVCMGRTFGAGRVFRTLDEAAFAYSYNVWLDGLIRDGEVVDLGAAREAQEA